MEGRKQGGSSSAPASASASASASPPPSSFASELFGSKEAYPSSSSAGIFGSIFAPPPRVLGKESVRYESERKQDFQNEPWRSKSGLPDDASNVSGGGQSMLNGDMATIYQEQRVQPCHLSSSIFYGGQENYCHPSSTQGSGLNSVSKKDPGEDDGSASRGNWWQGSLYY
ncbi:uncharacterized protein LOC104426421 [Eucalyptus grandis]|uniref:uncharacterized protein LOC104426421 n=1 Tax=Eucalyptus grandis TaxID=71139 RepID=UPI0005253C1E|nr:uncharacterized protein LOC104426421 [Eucalyptus grandis]